MSQQTIQNKLPIRYLSELDLEDYGCPDIISTLECINEIYDLDYLTEADFQGAVDHLKLELLDVDRFIKVNDCQEVTNPVFYSRNNIPTDDGLMSNKIFGITKDDRAGIFAYIDLHGWFIDPSCYKAWCRLDSKVKDCVHGMDTFIINDKGLLEQDPGGQNGIQFLKDNISKIKFKTSASVKRDMKIQYLEKNKTKMFINKYIVIPPFYRDTNTGTNSVGVNGVNVLYRNLLLAAIGLQSTQDYGLDQTNSLNARIQETLVNIYDWFAGNSSQADVDQGLGIAGKRGVMGANIGKTTNYSSRMVISSPELKAESVDDMMVDMDHTALPLAACLANYRPFIIYQVKRFFENEFVGNEKYPKVDINTGETIGYVTPVDPLIEFSDERIKREMDRFLHGYNNRFVPVQFPVEESDQIGNLIFKGSFRRRDGDGPEDAIYRRRLTWCDIFYQAACEVTRDKTVLITRYPIDSHFNQIATKIVVASTNETEPMYIEDTYYPYYPKIREEDIGKNTGNDFIDTLKMSNLYLDSMGGDYDGDTVTAKSPFTIESNEELIDFMDSKANLINLSGVNSRIVKSDCIQSLYSLTKTLKNGKELTDPQF